MSDILGYQTFSGYNMDGLPVDFIYELRIYLDSSWFDLAAYSYYNEKDYSQKDFYQLARLVLCYYGNTAMHTIRPGVLFTFGIVVWKSMASLSGSIKSNVTYYYPGVLLGFDIL